MASYWDTVLTSRMSRRRALVATGATAAGAALLAACGGGDDGGGGSTKDVSGLLSPIVDNSKDAKTGGTLTFNSQGDPLHFDGQAQGQVQLNVFQSLAHSSLVANKPGLGAKSSYSEVIPSLAASWEVSPDKLTVTFKLRDGVKWHNTAPVNGRAFEAADVIASYDRYVGAPTPNNKTVNFNKANPNAPIVSYEAPDSKTVVVKLKEPSSFIFQRMATMITGELGAIYPKEATGGYDPKQVQIGTGAYMLDKFTPSVEIVMKRNPEYFDKATSGFFDKINMVVLPDYAAQLAQFKAGALGVIQPNILPDDVLPTKKERPEIAMYPCTDATNTPSEAMRFGWLPIGGKPSPFLDIRLRQALSMAFDRDAWIDALFATAKFKDAGVAVNTYYNTSIGYVPGYTLDPRDTKTFGENSKYYAYNMVEAKKLFDAAKSSYGGDFPEIKANRVVNFFSAQYTQSVDIMDQWARDLGLKITAVPLTYNIDYLPKFVTQQGQFEGILYGIGAVTSPDPTDYWLWRGYSKTGPTSGQIGMGGTDGSKGDKSGDSTLDGLIDKAKAEYDSTKRTAIGADIQRHMAKESYYICRPGIADQFLMAQPFIQNFNAFQDDSRTVQRNIEGILHLWADPTKPGYKA